MKKIYVIDTNVLLQDPMAIYSFHNNDIVIPAVVLEEVDSKKRYMDEIGRNSRHVSRLLDRLRLSGHLHQGIQLDTGATLRVELNHSTMGNMQKQFHEMTNDNRILAVALNLQEEERTTGQGRPVILVSKDALMRVKADALGLTAEDFLSDRVVREYSSIYLGYLNRTVPSDVIKLFYNTRRLSLETVFPNEDFYPHQFLILKDECNPSISAIGKIDGEARYYEPLVSNDDSIWGVKARNAQQKMAIELLLRDDVPLVTMTGKAGTGKTLIALAAGLLQIEDLQKYKKLLIARPIVPMGKDIGYLPGEKEEKLRPWMQPIYDNLEYLFNTKKSGDLEKILDGMGSIQVEALTYIRGRSIPGQYIIIDEAQNLTKHEVKTILTRVGEGSKIILMGDPEQIDHPYLDESNNGLTYVVEMFKDQKLAGHIKLEKGERSVLAQLAADIL
ncbi:PhoH family protein [Brevibacillus laterosporus]|uniref:PhoH family protein n=1 Tax=Brevibacillus TaxID=55080 RepID=UPI0002404BE6|nr:MULTISPECIES: PhoH family protein [Brevibacillus]AUM66103.1 PhoH family protein [Brevibacillus laterosporus]MCR8962203.1 PhoH family protein [Brevibacillus laterosporus]MCZ0834358.1 PhoH family protein [Brevibacillus halotolerans]CCF14703.1 phoH-like family protein [Brevibacillus laterosporus GI-9]